MVSIDAASILPEDGTAGTLVGRVWIPAEGGPSVVVFREVGVFDVTADFPTVSALAEETNPVMALRQARGKRIGDLES